jgi:hypothetical protein
VKEQLVNRQTGVCWQGTYRHLEHQLLPAYKALHARPQPAAELLTTLNTREATKS